MGTLAFLKGTSDDKISLYRDTCPSIRDAPYEIKVEECEIDCAKNENFERTIEIKISKNTFNELNLKTGQNEEISISESHSDFILKTKAKNVNLFFNKNGSVYFHKTNITEEQMNSIVSL